VAILALDPSVSGAGIKARATASKFFVIYDIVRSSPITLV